MKPITLENALEGYTRSKEGTPNYKNIVGYGNKLPGFKLDPKSGQGLRLRRQRRPKDIHELTNKDIKPLVTPEKARRQARGRSSTS